ncbi:MAG: hypothetical protein JST35_10240 [Armatimonadetes bacterium]|nr:hypothetical protein [Armatimonadota bacterium]
MKRLIWLALAALSVSATAMWIRPDNDVPVDRLIKNVSESLKKQPKDAETALTLARLYSLRFALAKPVTQFYVKGPGTGFPAWSSVKVPREKKGVKLSAQEVADFRMSVKLYEQAIKLKARPVAELGYAWMHEQAAPFASQLGTANRDQWLIKAAALYKALYLKVRDEELKGEGRMIGIGDRYIASEAGQRYMAICESTKVVKMSEKERMEIVETMKTLETKMGPITPVVFSADPSTRLSELLRPNARVKFDLVGDGVTRTFDWVAPSTIFLAWDPAQTGKITSGRQLFGSGTFWAELGNGYKALAALDDNRDGWLSGRELTGIVGWQDRNGNGVSDLGEVTPITQLGVRRIATTWDGSWEKMPFSSMGIEMNDGSFRTSLDWTTTPKK